MKDKLFVSLFLVAVLVAAVVVVVTLQSDAPAPAGPPPEQVVEVERSQVDLPPLPVRPVAVPQPELPPAPEVVAATPEVAASTDEAVPLTMLQQLQLIRTNYYYDSFTQVGQRKIGKMMSHLTRRTVTVNEGDELEAGTGVVVESLDAEKAIVRLGDVTDEMICVGHPRFDFLKEWQQRAQRPTEEERELARMVYMAQHGDRANARAAAAGRPPAKEWHPKTMDQLRDEMLTYLETTGAEAAIRQGMKTREGVRHPLDLTPEEVEASRRAYYGAMGIDPNTEPTYRDEERNEPYWRTLDLPPPQKQ